MLILHGCSTIPTPIERTETILKLAAVHEWDLRIVQTSDFDITSLSPRDLSCSKGQPLTVYIEGDGFAWVTSSRQSLNPTPINPLMLKLALEHSDNCVVYLSRPCQYAPNMKSCTQKDWGKARFSQRIINSMDAAIDILNADRRPLDLIGYSGGGAIATLLTSQREDVIKLTTIAGNISTSSWVKKHRLTPLRGSLDPLDVAQSIKHIPQVHLVGGQDENITIDYAQEFKIKSGNPDTIQIRTVPDATHNAGWLESKSILLGS